MVCTFKAALRVYNVDCTVYTLYIYTKGCVHIIAISIYIYRHVTVYYQYGNMRAFKQFDSKLNDTPRQLSYHTTDGTYWPCCQTDQGLYRNPQSSDMCRVACWRSLCTWHASRGLLTQSVHLSWSSTTRRRLSSLKLKLLSRTDSWLLSVDSFVLR